MSIREIKDKSEIIEGLQVSRKAIINHNIDQGKILYIIIEDIDSTIYQLLKYEVGKDKILNLKAEWEELDI